MYRHVPVYNTYGLPSLHMCLLSLLAGMALAWLYVSGWLVPMLLTGAYASIAALIVIVACLAVGGRADR